MSKRSPHYEIVHTDADQPFHVRFVAGNGEITLHSEHYSRRSSAKRAAMAHTKAVLQTARDALFIHAEAAFPNDPNTRLDFQLAAEKLLSKDLAVALPMHYVDERS